MSTQGETPIDDGSEFGEGPYDKLDMFLTEREFHDQNIPDSFDALDDTVSTYSDTGSVSGYSSYNLFGADSPSNRSAQNLSPHVALPARITQSSAFQDAEPEDDVVLAPPKRDESRKNSNIKRRKRRSMPVGEMRGILGAYDAHDFPPSDS